MRGGEGTHYSWKWYEVAKYIATIRVHGTHGEHVTVNLDSWNALPADLQAMAENVGLLVGYMNYLYTREDDVDKRNLMVAEHGVTMFDLSPEAEFEAEAAAQRSLESFSAKDPKSAEYAGLIKEYLIEKGIWK